MVLLFINVLLVQCDIYRMNLLIFLNFWRKNFIKKNSSLAIKFGYN